MSEHLSPELIDIKKHSELTREDLLPFWNRVHSDVKVQNIEWWYRLGYEDALEPLYAIHQGQIVGQAGLIPVKLRIEDRTEHAIWFIDFHVLPEMQRKGVGQILTDAWMKMCKIRITLGPEKSMGVFAKFGWKQPFSAYRFALPIDVGKVARTQEKGWWFTSIARLVAPLYKAYQKHRRDMNLDCEVRPLKTVKKSEIFELFDDGSDFGLLRDEDWIEWRLYRSPFIDQYYVAGLNDAHCIFRVVSVDGVERLHVLQMNERSDEGPLSALLDSLTSWAFRNQIDLMWAICSSPKLTEIFSKRLPFKTPVRFAYHCDEQSTDNLFHAEAMPLQAIDSDFDLIYH